jgi:hypothetical protein
MPETVPPRSEAVVQGEQCGLRTETVVHVPERITPQRASRIAHECFRLNYQIPFALECRRPDLDAAGAGVWGRQNC